MNFGDRVRLLRVQRSLTQATLAERLDVSISYISKVERGRLHFGDYPSEKFIHKLAIELKADEDELLMLADKVPLSIRERIRERPEVFRVVANMDDDQIDRLMGQFSGEPPKSVR
ncbi:helix-turn-helix domain-containing protein [Rubripirellula reticaptiva]|uniref:Helix-turn-helix domain protein n=1 Tax=Rubripirellula reticaptiva TaxID=2528013 RepID=A0A5C6E9W8_9BACT|nr:helix-turn-helix transcriptional regulator [Rubripirellula reticaptiva]TWU46503.1 Helix-turn-helix domain protein [Rubripirellula reticaptiva]